MITYMIMTTNMKMIKNMNIFQKHMDVSVGMTMIMRTASAHEHENQHDGESENYTEHQ